jgi:hypothetical protein
MARELHPLVDLHQGAGGAAGASWSMEQSAVGPYDGLSPDEEVAHEEGAFGGPNGGF